MFTLEQIDELHARLGRAETLADTVALTVTYLDLAGEPLLVEVIV